MWVWLKRCEFYATKVVVTLSEASEAVMERRSLQESLQLGLNTDVSD